MSIINRDEVKQIYAAKAADLPVNECDSQLNFLKDALKHGIPLQGHILDAGCGNGNYSHYLATQGYRNIHAVDLFENIPLEYGVNYQCASIDELPYPDQGFDIIYSFSVLFYLDDPETGIKEFNRVLKPQGLLLISAHTKYSLATLWRILKRAFRLPGMSHLKNVRFYSAAQYCSMLQRQGFQIISVDGYGVTMIFGKIYNRLRRLLVQKYTLAIPCLSARPTSNIILRQLRSVFGYHSVILAVKK